jgi:ADP-heptose:LPS heptosyltransferase
VSTQSEEHVLYCRRIARGDVLLCTAITREHKRRRPQDKLYFRTDYPEIFKNNPDVVSAGPMERGPSTPFVNVRNLDFIRYENMSGCHLIDSFASGAGMKPRECPRITSLYPSQNDRDWVSNHLPIECHRNGYVVVAPGPGLWEGRNWSPKRWWDLINWIHHEWGLPVVVVGVVEGKSRHYALPVKTGHDFRGQTSTFMQLAALIGAARVFVGIDSFPCHVAGAMKTPRAVLFGITSPECILCDAPRTVAIISEPAHPFTGIRHRISGGMHAINLGNPPQNPMDTISVERVQATVTKLLV